MIFGVGFYSYTISFITFFFSSYTNWLILYKNKLNDLYYFNQRSPMPDKILKEIIKNLNHISYTIPFKWLPKDQDLFKNV